MIILIFNPLTLFLVYIAWAKSSGKLKTALTVIGAPIDFIVNITWFTLIFWELPKEPLLTKRVERLKNTTGKRGMLAKFICRLLNYFSENHCK